MTLQTRELIVFPSVQFLKHNSVKAAPCQGVEIPAAHPLRSKNEATMCALVLRVVLRFYFKVALMCGNPFAIYLNSVELLMVLI